MRSIGMLAVVTGTLVLAVACGDGGGTPPPDNVAPVANFTAPSCTINVACTFTDASTDDVAVTGWSWDFNGDGSADATTSSAAYTYTTAGTFSVILIVRDAEGLTSTPKIVAITIAPVPPVNTPPTAGFTFSCTDADCTFTNTSTDVAPGTIISYLWNFGDNATSDLRDPTHSYTVTAATNFTVTLTVTDNEGAIDVETQTVLVTPAAPLCAATTFEVECTLDIASSSNVRINLSSIDCELGGRVESPSPRFQSIFFNVCAQTLPQTRRLLDATGAPLVVAAGTQVKIRFVQREPDPIDPPTGPPAAHLEGTFPNWTISIDDGGNVGGTGEPDFTDVVLTVQATRP